MRTPSFCHLEHLPPLSSRTDGAVRAERCLHQLCRVVIEVDVVTVAEGSKKAPKTLGGLRILQYLCTSDILELIKCQQ